jgi:hypothetical protein
MQSGVWQSHLCIIRLHPEIATGTSYLRNGHADDFFPLYAHYVIIFVLDYYNVG